MEQHINFCEVLHLVNINCYLYYDDGLYGDEWQILGDSKTFINIHINTWHNTEQHLYTVYITLYRDQHV